MDTFVCCKSGLKHSGCTAGLSFYYGLAVVGEASLGCKKDTHQFFDPAVLGTYVCGG